MTVRQGEIYWVDRRFPVGSEPGLLRPYVIIQNNHTNDTRIGTVLACAMTSNMRRADAPGNVLVPAGTANLQQDSVINVSSVLTLDKSRLARPSGQLPEPYIRAAIDGLIDLIMPASIDFIEDRP